MTPILGNLIVIAILAVILFFAGKSFFKTIKNELDGKGCSACSGCSGNCSCGGSCHHDKK